MEIKHTNDEKRGIFEGFDGDKKTSEVTYTWAGPGRFIIDHTDVDPAYNGQGQGLKLVMAAVEFARAQQVKILPLCPFAKSVFNKNEDIRDVL